MMTLECLATTTTSRRVPTVDLMRRGCRNSLHSHCSTSLAPYHRGVPFTTKSIARNAGVLESRDLGSSDTNRLKFQVQTNFVYYLSDYILVDWNGFESSFVGGPRERGDNGQTTTSEEALFCRCCQERFVIRN
jgi:hypothetical protein